LIATALGLFAAGTAWAAGAPFRTDQAAAAYVTSLKSWHGVKLDANGFRPIVVCFGQGRGEFLHGGIGYLSFSCRLVVDTHDFQLTLASESGGGWSAR
jgi:hypothetical protein